MRVLLIVVLAAFSTACASTGATPRPFPGQMPSDAASRRPAEAGALPAAGADVVGTALSLRGTPYRNGGADLSGFDCSGFVWYVFAQHGASMPRTVAEQYEVGGKVKPEELRPGDLVFFRTAGRGASHVGIALGDGGFIHAPSSTGVVRVERLSAAYWSDRFVGARRP